MQRLCRKIRSSDIVSYQPCSYKCQQEIPGSIIWNLAARLFTLCVQNMFPTSRRLGDKYFLGFFSTCTNFLENITNGLFSIGFFPLPRAVCCLPAPLGGQEACAGESFPGSPPQLHVLLWNTDREMESGPKSGCFRFILGAESLEKKKKITL